MSDVEGLAKQLRILTREGFKYGDFASYDAACEWRQLGQSAEEALRTQAEDIAILRAACEQKDIYTAGVVAERDAQADEIERLRVALEFYAEAEHYQHDPYTSTIVQEDKGRIARAAMDSRDSTPGDDGHGIWRHNT